MDNFFGGENKMEIRKINEQRIKKEFLEINFREKVVWNYMENYGGIYRWFFLMLFND